MYQSLHTAVVGPGGHAIEIQIRSWEMHRTAEHGVAAHWRYKEGSRSDARIEAKVAWLRQLIEWRDQVADAEEFVESMKSDVFKEQIYVFTPAGDIIELPAGEHRSTSPTVSIRKSATNASAPRSTTSSFRSTTSCKTGRSSES